MVTYNIHKSRGLDGRVRPDRILRVLSEINPDIIALQEVVSRESSRADHHQTRYLADKFGYYAEIGENRRHQGGAYGNVLLSRYPIVAARNHDISVPGRERRGCLHAEIEHSSGFVVHLFNVHLGTAYFERRIQARELFRRRIFTDPEVAGRTIVLGDFNEWTRGLASRMFTAHFQSAHGQMPTRRAHTFPGVLPLLRLDHIYFDRQLRLEDVSIHRSPTALVASDHLPLVAEFTLPQPSDAATDSASRTSPPPPLSSAGPELRA